MFLRKILYQHEEKFLEKFILDGSHILMFEASGLWRKGLGITRIVCVKTSWREMRFRCLVNVLQSYV
jgi:hypothetical protein